MIRRPFPISQRIATVAGIGFATLTSGPAWAAGSNMPWEQPLNQILQSVEGPVGKILAVIIIIVTGLTLAFGDNSGEFRRLIQIVFGPSIAFAASSFFLSFFSLGGEARSDVRRCGAPPSAHSWPSRRLRLSTMDMAR
jgi:type IV secretory pathway VirB2 component (pilin)